VIVPAWERGEAEVRITRPFPQPLAAVSLGMTVGTPEEGIEAPVVRFESLAALEAARPPQVRGHIVFIDERMERARDGSGYGPAVPSAAAARRSLPSAARSPW
jgi:carboxypeptidase Q